MHCVHCGAAGSAGARFCIHCGHVMPPPLPAGHRVARAMQPPPVSVEPHAPRPIAIAPTAATADVWIDFDDTKVPVVARDPGPKAVGHAAPRVPSRRPVRARRRSALPLPLVLGAVAGLLVVAVLVVATRRAPVPVVASPATPAAVVPAPPAAEAWGTADVADGDWGAATKSPSPSPSATP